MPRRAAAALDDVEHDAVEAADAAPSRRLKVVGHHSGDGRKLIARSFMSASTSLSVRPNSSAASSRFRLKSVRPTIPRVSRLISAATSSGAPLAPAASQRSSMARVASVMVVTKPVSRWRWKAGWASRRWRRQKSPSLVKRPSPTSTFIFAITIPFS